MGKAVFPKIVAQLQRLPQCRLVLARCKDSGTVDTVVFVRDEVGLFIDTDGSLAHGTLAYFYEDYEVIREYEKGETLSVTV